VFNATFNNSYSARPSDGSCVCVMGLGLEVMVFNATFNNISDISWRSVLLVGKT